MSHPANGSPPVVLTIAGFDPSGGAGTAADLKTFAAHNCYGVAAITALTIQNTQGVTAVYAVEVHQLKECLQSLAADGNLRAVKIGMLASRANSEIIAEFLDANTAIPSVLDPVLRSSSGFDLVDAGSLEFLRAELFRRVSVITPNLAEASALSGLTVESVEGMKAAARALVQMGARVAVVTGGHLDRPTDVYFDGVRCETFAGDHVRPANTHGTGCAFSSAIASNLALGRNLRDSVMLAKAYVTEAIRKAYATGPGRVPLNHFFRAQQQSRGADYMPAVPEPEAVH
jgi:hydroxymethylpyrimidine/phosphomethylpyrimidine kinase